MPCLVFNSIFFISCTVKSLHFTRTLHWHVEELTSELRGVWMFLPNRQSAARNMSLVWLVIWGFMVDLEMNRRLYWESDWDYWIYCPDCKPSNIASFTYWLFHKTPLNNLDAFWSHRFDFWMDRVGGGGCLKSAYPWCADKRGSNSQDGWHMKK